MKLRNIGICAAFLLFFAAAIQYRSEITAAILEAGSRCILVIVPSLYLFSVLAAFCVRSGVLEILASPLERLAQKCLHMDGSILMVLLFSQTAGYPIGTQLVQRMYEKGAVGRIERELLLCTCFGCGPAFLIGTVGAALHLPPLLAVFLQLSVSLPNFLLTVFLTRYGNFLTNRNPELRARLNPQDFTESVENGACAMLKICSMILVFAAISGIAKGSGAVRFLSHAVELTGSSADTAEQLVLSILEISNLPAYLQQGGSLPMAAALLSFGGACVHLQNAAICGGDFPWRKFLCIRLITAVCAYFLCSASVHLCLDGELAAMLPIRQAYEMQLTTGGAIPVICLLVMSVLLLAKEDRLQSLKKYTKFRGNLSG